MSYGECRKARQAVSCSRDDFGERNMIQRNDQFTPPPEGACPLCGYAMDGYQCKLVCPNCGYREDCSDTFRAGPMEPPDG
jgi:hypothetical protein